MAIFYHQITRRMFLKISSLLSIALPSIHYKKAFAATKPQNTIAQPSYGTGNYSSGDYPGYTTYLPQISKEKQ